MIEYVEPVVVGILASQAGGVVSSLFAKLQADAGVEFPRWALVLATVGAVVAGLVAAGLAGYYIEGPRAAVWSLCGGIVGPQVWPDFRRVALAAISKRVERA